MTAAAEFELGIKDLLSSYQTMKSHVMGKEHNGPQPEQSCLQAPVTMEDEVAFSLSASPSLSD